MPWRIVFPANEDGTIYPAKLQLREDDPPSVLHPEADFGGEKTHFYFIQPVGSIGHGNMQNLKEVNQVELRTTARPAEDGTKVAADIDGGLGDSAEIPSKYLFQRAVAPAFNEQTNYLPKRKMINVALPSSRKKETI